MVKHRSIWLICSISIAYFCAERHGLYVWGNEY